MPFDNNIRFTKCPNGLLNLCEQGIIVRHYNALTDWKLNVSKANYQEVPFFVNFGFIRVKDVLDFNKQLIEAFFSNQVFFVCDLSIFCFNFGLQGLNFVEHELAVILQRQYRAENIFDLNLIRLVAHVRRIQFVCDLMQDVFHPERDLFRFQCFKFFTLRCDLKKSTGHKQGFAGLLVHHFFLVRIFGNKSIGFGKFFPGNCKRLGGYFLDALIFCRFHEPPHLSNGFYLNCPHLELTKGFGNLFLVFLSVFQIVLFNGSGKFEKFLFGLGVIFP